MEIFNDWYKGVVDSLRIFSLIKHIKKLPLRKHALVIAKVNIFLYVIPVLFLGTKPNHVISFVIGLVATLIHVIKYFDIVCSMSSTNKKSSKKYDGKELVSLGILMAIYQIVVQLVIGVTNYVFWPGSILLLFLYHSLYCFNNLWQCQGIPIPNRIKRLETMWAYYAGYSTIATILYLFSDNLLVAMTYNIFFALNIATAFVIDDHKVHKRYPSINLSLFSYFTRKVVKSLS